DYIFRWLASRFLDAEDQEAVGIVRREPEVTEEKPAPAKGETTSEPSGELKLVAPSNGNGGHQKLAFVVNADAPTCSECGAITVRSGSCYKCLNCGATTGCS
ncbi:MAG: vitamin B12-dependent ribonucleotide reductase, partial [Candidatus Dormibacteraeota bacterium]|nr:vitamin B12-dependent ribonucleotide reductase [Candidatus Dormibacteraeota bacterium]